MLGLIPYPIKLEEQLPFHPLIALLSFLLFSICLYKYMKPAVVRGNRPPPSPPKLPILGNLHQLGKLPHRSLRSCSQKYGELMLLHIGSKPSLVVSSADAAREIMKTHDAIFSNRPKQRFASKLLYDSKDVAFASYGEYLRQIKSICIVQLLNNKKVRSFRTIREEEVALLVEKLKASSSSVVNLSEMIVTLTNDIICRTAFGKKYTGNNEGTYFKELMAEFVILLGVISMGDVIPWLSWIDRVSGMESRVEKLAEQLDEFLGKIVQEHQDRTANTIKYSHSESDKRDEEKDFVDILLEIQTENKQGLITESIKALVLLVQVIHEWQREICDMQKTGYKDSKEGHLCHVYRSDLCNLERKKQCSLEQQGESAYKCLQSTKTAN